ncbi:MAG: hypothetical protein ACK5CU_01485 [Rhodoluna sp.]|jgi:hypothetical protein
MNLDALFEDLEAQAYFHQAAKPAIGANAAKSALVIRQSEHQASLVLSSPLLGNDFIAGFAATSAPCWVVVPAQSFTRIEVLDEGNYLTGAELSFVDLVERKLCAVTLKIQTRLGDISPAQVVSVSGSLVEVLSAGKISYLASSAIEALVVENLSNLEKLSAT